MIGALRVRLALFILAFSGTLHAQRHDYIWRHGYQYGVNDSINSQIDFSLDSLAVTDYLDKIDFTYSCGFICDSSGVLQLQTSGCYIANGQGKIVEGGEAIGGTGRGASACATEGYYLQPQQGFFLPRPGYSSQYYYIYATCIDPLPNSLDYTLVDMEANQGAGKVLAKDIHIVADTIQPGAYAAVKHANGRDWWIITLRRVSNRLYKTLLDPVGFHDYGYQELGVPTLDMYGIADMAASPDGSVIAHSMGKEDLRLWDFDRCTGTLSNAIHYQQEDYQDSVWHQLSNGVAFSQNGRYVYRNNKSFVYQYDLQSSDIAQSIQIVGTVLDQPRSVINTTLEFGYAESGPDGRIYIKPALGGVDYLHVINHPERGGLASELRYGDIYLPQPTGAMPIFPVYRLGPIDGSPCDTLGLNNVPLAGFRYDKEPALLVEFTSVCWYEPEFYHWDFGDPASGTSNTSLLKHPDHVFTSPGGYKVCLEVCNGYGCDSVCKQVMVYGSQALTYGQGEALVFPNPAISTIRWVWSAKGSGQLFITNALGQTMVTIPVAADIQPEYDVSLLPSGVYFWVVHLSGGERLGGKFLKQ
jgi:PKD repeat protein